MSGIVLLGLGPGSRNQLTLEAMEVMSAASEIWVREPLPGELAQLAKSVAIRVLRFGAGERRGPGAISFVPGAPGTSTRPARGGCHLRGPRQSKRS